MHLATCRSRNIPTDSADEAHSGPRLWVLNRSSGFAYALSKASIGSTATRAVTSGPSDSWPALSWLFHKSRSLLVVGLVLGPHGRFSALRVSPTGEGPGTGSGLWFVPIVLRLSYFADFLRSPVNLRPLGAIVTDCCACGSLGLDPCLFRRSAGEQRGSPFPTFL